MKKLLSLLIVAAIISCNNNDTKNTTTNTTENKTTVASETKNTTTEKTDAAVVSFMLNGQNAITAAGENDEAKQSATYQLNDKILDIYLQGYAAPDNHRHQLALFIKNFSGHAGEITNATAQFSRRDETKKDFIYGNRTAGSFKVTITRYDSLPSTNAYIKKAVMSGTFEGDMTCETCFDPAVKSSPFAQVQHFTAGKFENVPVIIMSNK